MTEDRAHIFFEQFLVDEYEALKVFATEPDNGLANATTRAFRERRPRTMPPNLKRSGRYRPHRFVDRLTGAHVRVLFAVVEHGTDTAVAYVSSHKPTLGDEALLGRLIAARTAAGWQVSAWQLGCATCFGMRVDDCDTCIGTGFDPILDGTAALLPPITACRILHPIQHATDQFYRDALERDGGEAFRQVLATSTNPGA